MGRVEPPPADERSGPPLCGCPCCGLVQRLPPPAPGRRAVCARCAHAVGVRPGGGRHLTAAIALAALVIYPVAITMPVMSIERMGHRHEAGVLDGARALIRHGEVAVGLVVLLASVVVPAVKLVGLLVLTGAARQVRPRLRAATWRAIEASGRWGMLDVLLVALLVSVLKLGDLAEVTPGPGALAFTLLVVLSLAASMTFDPHAMWDDVAPPRAEAAA